MEEYKRKRRASLVATALLQGLMHSLRSWGPRISRSSRVLVGCQGTGTFTSLGGTNFYELHPRKEKESHFLNLIQEFIPFPSPDSPLVFAKKAYMAEIQPILHPLASR